MISTARTINTNCQNSIPFLFHILATPQLTNQSRLYSKYPRILATISKATTKKTIAKTMTTTEGMACPRRPTSLAFVIVVAANIADTTNFIGAAALKRRFQRASGTSRTKFTFPGLTFAAAHPLF